MTRCIYCHLVKDLDSKGRCRSCANAGDATAYGLHYGEYMYRKEHGATAGETALREHAERPTEAAAEVQGLRKRGAAALPHLLLRPLRQGGQAADRPHGPHCREAGENLPRLRQRSVERFPAEVLQF